MLVYVKTIDSSLAPKLPCRCITGRIQIEYGSRRFWSAVESADKALAILSYRPSVAVNKIDDYLGLLWLDGIDVSSMQTVVVFGTEDRELDLDDFLRQGAHLIADLTDRFAYVSRHQLLNADKFSKSDNGDWLVYDASDNPMAAKMIATARLYRRIHSFAPVLADVFEKSGNEKLAAIGYSELKEPATLVRFIKTSACGCLEQEDLNTIRWLMLSQEGQDFAAASTMVARVLVAPEDKIAKYNISHLTRKLTFIQECWEANIDVIADEHPDGLSLIEREALKEMSQVAYDTGIDVSIATVIKANVPEEDVVFHEDVMSHRRQRIES